MLKSKSTIGASIIFSLAILLFSINLDRPPHPDELHHVLAAQQLVEIGRPVLAEGEYWRGILHTWLVAISYEVFGDGLASARIPTVLIVALVLSILFLWVRREVGPLAAWLTGFLLLSSPFTVEIAQFSRFYALQMLFFVLGCVCLYYSLANNVPIVRRLLLGALAIVLLLLAIQQQITTLMGVVGVAVWALAVILQELLQSRAATRFVKNVALLGLVLAGACIVLTLAFTDVLDSVLATYRQTPLFNASRKDDYWFYYARFFLFYPTLWPLIGVLAIFAILHKPRLAWLAICVFGGSFLLASFAGSKATRYLSFAPPFLALLWGVGLAYAWPSLSRFSETARTRLVETFALPPQIGAVTGHALVVLAFLIVLLSNPFWLRTATIIGDVALPFETPTTDWRAARQTLTPWIRDSDIMITTEELGAIYFLGRSDVRYSPSKLQELAPTQRKEFGIDHRTGRPVIASPTSVERLLACYPRGFVVGPIEDWGKPILIGEDVQAILREHAKPIGVPGESHLFAWGWNRESQEARPNYCANLDRFSRRGMRQ